MNLNIIGPWNNLGYGVACQNIIKALHKAGTTIAYWPINNRIDECDPNDKKLVIEIRQNTNNYDPSAPSLRIWHQNQLSLHVGKGEHIGFPIFELDAFYAASEHHMKQQDRLFVCSNWAKRVIHENDIGVPTHVIPLGVDTELFKPVSDLERIKRVSSYNSIIPEDNLTTWKTPSKGSTKFFNCGK